MNKKTIILFFLAIVVSIGICWLKNQIYWRKYNDNSINVEVADGLAIDKVKIKWIAYNQEGIAFANGQPHELDDIVPFQWVITYADSIYLDMNFNANATDGRQDFDYDFKLFRKDTIIFCTLISRERHTIFSNTEKRELPFDVSKIPKN